MSITTLKVDRRTFGLTCFGKDKAEYVSMMAAQRLCPLCRQDSINGSSGFLWAARKDWTLPGA